METSDGRSPTRNFEVSDVIASLKVVEVSMTAEITYFLHTYFRMLLRSKGIRWTTSKPPSNVLESLKHVKHRQKFRV